MLMSFDIFFVSVSVDCLCCMCHRNDYGVRGTHFIIQSTAKVGLLTSSRLKQSDVF